MEIHKGVASFEAAKLEDWRGWLESNHSCKDSVWLIIQKKQSATHSFVLSQAIDEALCFGWVDSKSNSRDANSYYVYFAQRNPKSNWSRINKQKVEKLIESGRMHSSGLAMIEEAKANGTWDALNDVENLIIPADLQLEFAKYPNAYANWEAFPRSVKRGILEWIFNAKRAATRRTRVQKTAGMAEQNKRANQYERI